MASTHISIRITGQRRANLDALAEIAHTDGDTGTIDFAVMYALAHIPSYRSADSVLVDALRDVASGPCCESPGCSIEDPCCDTMTARAALAYYGITVD